jgi:Flp pilus assembly protein TadG
MRRPSMSLHPARSRQRGQAAVEAGLVIVPLILMLLAIIDVSVAIFIINTLEYAARQGVRYAITGQTSSGLQQNGSIRKVVRDNSMGFLTFAPDSKITITYYSLVTDPNSANVNTWQKVTGAGSNSNGNLVKVSVAGYSWAWMVPYIWGFSALNINAASTDISGACVNGVCPTIGP